MGLFLLMQASFSSANTNDAKELNALRAEMESLLRSNAVPGAIIVVVEQGEPLLTMTRGLASRERNEPMTAQHWVAVGSMSKNLTSLALMRAEEQGLLSLADPLLRWLPGFRFDGPPTLADTLTLAHLLSHTAGIEGSTYEEYGLNLPAVTPSEYTERMQARIALRWSPGDFFSYANPGHTLAAAALEAACHCSFDNYMQDEIFRPLGMKTATFTPDAETQHLLASSYHSDGITLSKRWEMAIRPSGSLLLTAADLEALVLFYATRGQAVPDVLSQAGLTRMETPAQTALARQGVTAGGYALGNFNFISGKSRFYGHTGSTDGFRSWFGYQPELASGFAIVLNGGEENARAKLQQAIGRYLTRGAPEPRPQQAVALPANTALQGWWSPVSHTMLLRDWLWRILGAAHITAQKQGIVVDHGWPGVPERMLVHTGDNHFRDESGLEARYGLVKDALGSPALILGAAYRPISALWVYGARLPLVLGALGSLFALASWAYRAVQRLTRQLPIPIVLTQNAVSAAAYLGLAITFLNVGMLGPLDLSGELGRVGAWSLLLLGLSLVGPAAAATSTFQCVRGRGSVLSLCIACALLLAWLVPASFGWVPLITWNR